MRIVHFGPTRPWFRPGSEATLEIEFAVSEATQARVVVELLDLDRVAARVERRVSLAKGRSRRRVRMPLPADARRGYGLQLSVVDRAGTVLAAADEAVEALDGWWESPRHSALTRFDAPAETAAAVRALAAWHVTVVQDYDWMYRHYRYSAPSRERLAGDAFVDALGRRVSHAAVRAGVQAGHRVGIATLAYGSVYGAEREYVERHPDERVFDTAGVPISLGGTFFINDIRPDRPWRTRLLAEYAAAIRRFGFDGVHMDTYGPPHHAIAADGRPVDFAATYPGLIADAAATVAAVRPGARVLFNCVEGFPLDAVGDAPAAAIYLELWPPDERYEDVLRWIERARAVGRGRAVVIAAYLSCLRTNEIDLAARPAVIEAAVLLTSLIAAAGAYHHVLADGDRILVEGYYPEARRMRRAEAAELRAAWSFAARYVHLVADPAAWVEEIDGLEIHDARGVPVPLALEPRAGAVWARTTRRPDGGRVLNLVDLRAQPDDRWDALRSPVGLAVGWRLRWPGSEELVAMSPWSRGGRAAQVVIGRDGAARLPTFRRWAVVVDKSGSGPSSSAT